MFNYNKEINDKDPKFQVFDRVRTSRFKNIFAIGYNPNWSEQVFVIENFNNAASWTYTINDLNGEEIIVTFYEKELKKQIKKKKVIKTKGDKLHVKWKGYDNSPNSWVDKKDAT